MTSIDTFAIIFSKQASKQARGGLYYKLGGEDIIRRFKEGKIYI